MQDLNDKVTGNSLTATEWNEVPSEIQNVIEAMGIILSSGDLSQLLKAISQIAKTGSFGTDSGTANTYVVTSNAVGPSLVSGLVVTFDALNDNTGASTINLDGLGVQNIKVRYGSTIDTTAGQISGLTKLIYDGTNFALYDGRIIPNESSFSSFDGAGATLLNLIKATTGSIIEAGNTINDLELIGSNIDILLGASKELALQAIQNDALIMFYNAVESARTSDISTATVTTGLRVRDKNSDLQDVGFNTMPTITTTIAQTLTSSNCGKFIQVQAVSNISVLVGTDANIPNGATWMIGNNSGSSQDITVGGGGSTLTWMDGSGSATLPIGNRTLANGAVATVTKVSSGNYLIFGGGIS